jgi:hypothetical protein
MAQQKSGGSAEEIVEGERRRWGDRFFPEPDFLSKTEVLKTKTEDRSNDERRNLANGR